MPGGCLSSCHAVSESLGNSRAAHPATDLCSPCSLPVLLSGQAQRHGCPWASAAISHRADHICEVFPPPSLGIGGLLL